MKELPERMASFYTISICSGQAEVSRQVKPRNLGMANMVYESTEADNDHPILEHLIITHLAEDKTTMLTFPETLQAPHLRHLALDGFALPIGCRLLTTAIGLVTLCLFVLNPSTYFNPNTLLQWLSSMLQVRIADRIHTHLGCENKASWRKLLPCGVNLRGRKVSEERADGGLYQTLPAIPYFAMATDKPFNFRFVSVS